MMLLVVQINTSQRDCLRRQQGALNLFAIKKGSRQQVVLPTAVILHRAAAELGLCVSSNPPLKISNASAPGCRRIRWQAAK